ncbi:MAG: hypothetical protein Kow0042_30220 [Calditrichia bacterium]
MRYIPDYQEKYLDALHNYFYKLKKERKDDVSMSDAVISWLTDGHAERFRNEYLKKHTIFS